MQPTLQTLSAELAAALANLTPQQTQLTPTGHPEKWSIQQIADHLDKSYRYTIPVLETRIQKRSPTRASPSIAQRVGQFTLITLGRFPSGRPSPEAVCPTPEAPLSGSAIHERIHTGLTRIDDLLITGTRLFGPTRRAASHMLLGPLSMSQWARFHLIHGRHHIKQIQTIRHDHQL